MNESETTAQDALREGILRSGHNDFVSMADVQSCISRARLAASVVDRERLVVDTVRSLLVDGLVEVGVIPGRNDSGFKTWPGTVDQVMTRFIDRFVGHYDDPLEWEYAIWLNLTAKGQQASNDIVGKAPDS
jgi:hypothetical protein